jgi:hypothetical protein
MVSQGKPKSNILKMLSRVCGSLSWFTTYFFVQ